MSTLILAHIVTGLAGIAAGLVIVGRIMLRRRVTGLNAVFAVFMVTTLAACGTGFVFLPSQGLTSA